MEMEREKEKEKKKEANRGAILCATSLFQSSLPTSYPMNNTGGLFFLQESRSKNTIQGWFLDSDFKKKVQSRGGFWIQIFEKKGETISPFFA